MHRTYQMARILKVASLIRRDPRKWNRPRLAQELRVDKATISRYIGELREMGMQVISHGRGGYEIITDIFLPELNFDWDEALGLVTAASFYRANEGQQAQSTLDSAIAKIRTNLPKGTQRVLQQIVPQIDVPDFQVSQTDESQPQRETLYDAIRERLKVNIEYNSFSGGKRRRHRLSPYAVMFRKRAWYVIGHSETFNRILTFRINRIHSFSIGHTPYTIPEDFSVQRYMEKSWDVMLGPETHVVIEFAPRIAPLIREVRWHSTQQIQENADGGLRFEATVAGWLEVGWWVLGWGDEAEVIEPRELREWVAQTAQKMVRMYRKN